MRNVRTGIQRLAVVLAFLGLLAGTAGAQKTVTVFAAASLTDAFNELGKKFESTHPGTQILFNFAGSQQLVGQIREGAAADIFASADSIWMGVAVDSGLVSAPVPFARNLLIVIVPRNNPGRVDKLQDLARAGTKVVMAADAVPAGRYSRTALRNLSGVDGFPADYVRRVLANVVSNEASVKGVVAKVQLAEADAGVVYQSDVTPPVARVVKTIAIPDSFNVMATYPIGVVRGSRNADLAHQFIDLLVSSEGQATLQRYRFIPVGASAMSH